MDASECSGLLKGDPDIAGIGVVSAIWITNFVAVIASAILWWFTTVKKISLTRSKLCQRVLACAFTISDTALITMLAIVCSSITLIKSEPDTSLYHVFIARCLAQNCTTGLFCSVPFYDYRTLKGYRGNWGTGVRVILYLCASIIWLYWTGLCIHEFRSKWHENTPSCFYNDNWVPGEYEQWMRLDLFWTPCAWAWYYLELWPMCEKYCRTTNAFVPEVPDRIKSNWQRYRDNVRDLGTGQSTTVKSMLSWAAICVFAIYILIEVVACLLVTLFVCPPSTAPWHNLFFFIWSVYDVSTVWRANKHIVVACPPGQYTSLQGNRNPEWDWGFGQLLPMFLLMLPALTLVDSFDE